MSTTSSEVRTYPGMLLLLLGFGLALRLLFIALNDRPLFSDEKEYDQLAYNLATRASYTYDSAPTAYRPIGYPALVGLCYYIFGHYPIVLKIVQALIDTATSYLIFLLLAGHPERTRYLAALLWTLFPPAIFYSCSLLSETLFTSLLVLSGLLLIRHHGYSWRLTLLGALLGILVLIKPTAIAFVLILLFLIPQFEIPLKKLIPAMIVFFAVLAPWLVRNYIVFDHVALSSNGGVNLMIGNNETSTGAYKYTFDASIFKNSKDEFDVDRKAMGYAAQYIVHHPGSTVVHAAKKLAHLFESEGGILVMTFHERPEDVSERYATKYASLSLFWVLLTNFAYFTILLAGVFGFLSASRDKIWWLAAALLLSWIVVHSVFFGGGRFHFPLMPMAAVYAAQLFGNPKQLYGSLSQLRKAMAFLIVFPLSILWIYEALMIYHG